MDKTTNNKRRKLTIDDDSMTTSMSNDEDSVSTASPSYLKDPRILGLLLESKFLTIHQLGRLFLLTAKNMKPISTSGGNSNSTTEGMSNDDAKGGDEDDDISVIYEALSRHHWETLSTVASLMTATGASSYQELFQKLMRLPISPVYADFPPKYTPSDYTMLVEARLENGELLFQETAPGNEMETSNFWVTGSVGHRLDEPLTCIPFDWDKHTRKPDTGREWRDYLDSMHKGPKLDKPSKDLRLTGVGPTKCVVTVQLVRKEPDGRRQVIRLLQKKEENCKGRICADIPHGDGVLYVYSSQGHDAYSIQTHELVYDYLPGGYRNAISRREHYLSKLKFDFNWVHAITIDPSAGTNDAGTTYTICTTGFELRGTLWDTGVELNRFGNADEFNFAHAIEAIATWETSF